MNRLLTVIVGPALLIGIMFTAGTMALAADKADKKQSDKKAAKEPAATTPPQVTGDWTGEWGPYNPSKGTALAKEKCKDLECVVVEKDGQWQATFTGECGGPYKYTIEMTGRQVGDVVLFKGTTDLGKNEGVYDWLGRATATEFAGFYTSSHHVGVFRLKRAAE